MLEVIMMQPKTAGNLGAVARAMKNFDFTKLVLIDPRCSPKSIEARKRAKHAVNILEKAITRTKRYLNGFDYLIGTTAIVGSDYNLTRTPMLPEQLAGKISSLIDSKKKIGLLIGREDSGLTNEELEMCDFIVTIPGSKRYPTLNISHSAAILLYEIFRARKKPASTSHIILAGKKEKKALIANADKAISRLSFNTKEKKATQKKLWRRIIGKSFLSKREVMAMHGLFSKIKKKSKEL